MIRTYHTIASILLVSLLCVGCGSDDANSSSKNNESDQAVTPVRLDGQVVEASCGQCQFDQEGTGCDLAIRVEGQVYFVTGANIDDHGDAHAEDGMCNAIRQATVTGEVVDGKFVAESFELSQSSH